MLDPKIIQPLKDYIERFSHLSEKEWESLTRVIHPLNLKKKEFLMQPNSSKNRVAFILSGLLRTYFISEKGDEYTTDFCKQNEIAVNYRLTTGKDDDYYTQAVINSEILVIEYQDILNSGFKKSRWETLQSKIIEYYHPLKLEREKSLLSMDTEEKYLSFLKKYRDIASSIPQYQIASYLGITPIALSRVKKRIKTFEK